PAAADLFGWGVIYGLHARTCIQRARVWQAEHYIGAVRDHALSLACLRRGIVAVQARGYDDLPPDVLALFEHTHIGSLDPNQLRRALALGTRALLAEGRELPGAASIAQRIAELT
ncbi:MAG TPA: nucleotidyltransferase domain-containing protein, partial [Candidatus Dormibacteraeota bacterium]|nr:nucleotidyltransferase domain-containing protein [Candidatus Dormibacteraeota bacterium]